MNIQKAIEDLKMLDGLPPYDGGGNICKGDGYFAKSLEKKYHMSVEQLRKVTEYDKIYDEWEKMKSNFVKGEKKMKESKGRRIELEAEEVVTHVSATKKAKKTEVPPTMSKNDFLEIVTSVSTTKVTTTTKNGISTLTPPEAKEGEIDYREVVDSIVKWKKVEKEAKAERETREAELIDYVKPIQEEDGFNGKYQKSYYVQGIKEQVTYVSADKFSAPKEEDIGKLQTILGNDFTKVIQSKIELCVRDEVFSNKALQKELMDLMPKNPDGSINKEIFGKFFVAKTEWFVTDGFDQKRFTLPKKVFCKVMEILRQTKPSIK